MGVGGLKGGKGPARLFVRGVLLEGRKGEGLFLFLFLFFCGRLTFRCGGADAAARRGGRRGILTPVLYMYKYISFVFLFLFFCFAVSPMQRWRGK